MSDRQRQLAWVPRYKPGRQGTRRQVAVVPRYIRPVGDYCNPNVIYDEEPPSAAINASESSNTIPIQEIRPSEDTIANEQASSDNNILSEAQAAPAEPSFSVEEVDPVRIFNQDDKEYASKIMCSLFNKRDKYELIPILDDLSKYLKTEKAKENTRKNIVNGKNNTKHKSKLVPLLTRGLEKESQFIENKSDRGNCYMVDVMNNLRRIQWKTLKNQTFQKLARVLCESVKEKCKNPKRIDFVFDIYREFSPKSAARVKRYGNIKPIEFSVGDGETLPIDSERNFWASEKNKIEIQEYIRQFIAENYARYWGNVIVVLSETDKETCKVCLTQSSDSPPEKMDFQSLRRHDIEEADDRIIVHIHHAILCGFDHICIFSQDTDIFILAMYYYWIFKNIGLKQIWMGSGHEKFFPIHEVAEFRGRELCQVLPAMHNLTGSDCTKKVGTKHQGLQADPVKFLADFAHGTSPEEVSTSTETGEEYLIQVLQKGNAAKTFDELPNPPMTSASVKQHILRAFYNTHKTINILDANYNPLDPQSYGYQEINGLLMPIEPDNHEENVMAPL